MRVDRLKPSAHFVEQLVHPMRMLEYWRHERAIYRIDLAHPLDELGCEVA